MRTCAVLVSSRPVPLIPLSISAYLCLKLVPTVLLVISVLSSLLSFVVSDSHKHNKLLASVGGSDGLTDRPTDRGWCSQLKVLS